MAKYLTRLYDRWATIILANSKDFDSRDPKYGSDVTTLTWATVKRLREGRRLFRMQVNEEARKETRRREAEKAKETRRADQDPVPSSSKRNPPISAPPTSKPPTG